MIVQSNYRVFVTQEMLVRTKRITEILNVGGFVCGVAYRGDPLLARIPRKEVEELTELAVTFRDIDLRNSPAWKRKMLQEMSDIMAVTVLGISCLKRPESRTLAPNPAILRGKWRELVVPTTPSDHAFRLNEELSHNIAAMLVETKQGIPHWMKRGDMGFTPDELDAAMAAKSQKWGDFEGLAIRGSPCRSSARWCGCSRAIPHGYSMSSPRTISKTVSLTT